ncbi:DMT family transporter [Solitalea canadensis]|uniref:Cation/cationic drug transporter n=1 Tax=Solitalea canadensis (strain ATCC 29591 / DSM 3403 / JCM 21819 / LMG 8368 / NBRC 15130 / NCIMB 12057 / USAM 9D) TaxID=929556 RepID=H8KT22_SOLCM|nr:multidrug efflux SMR transporter [Solitalea canadensis]AFD05593.1 cation/cationic drug transporter [Solitalea canadensis DSM 3403]
MKYVYLLLAILFEIIGTSALQASAQFTKWKPSLLVVLGYASAFFFLSLSLRSLQLGVAYAIWSGVGIVIIILAGIFLFKQIPDTPAIIGMALIVIGVVVINLFSKTTSH